MQGQAPEDKWGPKPKEHWNLMHGQQLNAADLNIWLQEMSNWAANVRADIQRLEKYLKLAAGDPGAPPPPPE
jgi:hypothetical protein